MTHKLLQLGHDDVQNRRRAVNWQLSWVELCRFVLRRNSIQLDVELCRYKLGFRCGQDSFVGVYRPRSRSGYCEPVGFQRAVHGDRHSRTTRSSTDVSSRGCEPTLWRTTGDRHSPGSGDRQCTGDTDTAGCWCLHQRTHLVQRERTVVSHLERSHRGHCTWITRRSASD